MCKQLLFFCKPPETWTPEGTLINKVLLPSLLTLRTILTGKVARSTKALVVVNLKGLSWHTTSTVLTGIYVKARPMTFKRGKER